MTRVKICGLMNRDDIHMAVAAGADALGFVTEYPIPVPWNLSRQAAAELVASVPPFVTTTAVVGGFVQDMVDRALCVKPHFLQLHGDETLEDIQWVCEQLAHTGIKVLKALRINIETGEAQFSETDPLKACHLLAQSGVSGLVVDSKTSSRPAGTGVTLDWQVMQQVSTQLELPLILAGGLNVDNVGEAIRIVHPYGVDVISGVEKQAGVKDGQLMIDFVRAVKTS
ncbi:MAG: phosphoribosylanthranilate isomerase [Phycisphaerae bacterium]|nr:phosphoribosylanthranilate isomerase [Phycisphaerae bacterium]